MKPLFRLAFAVAVSLGSVYSVFAQLPNTQAYLFRFQQLNDTLFHFFEPEYLSGFNPEGYNNQPCFISKDKLLLTVMIPDSFPQTDIYSLDLDRNRLTRLTATLESEYSPQPIPESDYFSVVRVDHDNTSVQRFWKYPLDGNDYGTEIWDGLTTIGYYYWLGPVRFLAFLVDSPPVLDVFFLEDGRRKRLAEQIGRSFARLPDGNLAFVSKEEVDWKICQLDTYFFKVKPEVLISTLEGSEDFVCLQDGTLLMGQESRLYKYRPGWDLGWIEIADFAQYGIKAITRLAVNGEGVLVLIDKKEKD
jgi:hypothetical protein